MANNSNPFKFGTVVDDPFFTNRTEELARIDAVLKSNNHLIMISPRRFGKTSLIKKVVKECGRDVLMFDLQMVNSLEDFSAQYLRKIYRIFPAERIKQFIKNFRIVPTISLNPTNNEFEISFQNPGADLPMLEDVLNLLEQISSPARRPIVILDEFQELMRLGVGTDRKFRSIMQHHQNINYVFLGSQESMMREIFEKKRSPFYHFGLLMPLNKIKKADFIPYLESGFQHISENSKSICDEILVFSDGHPYYTQQLAYSTWNMINQNPETEMVVKLAITEIILIHDLDYERLWTTFNNTDKKTLVSLIESNAKQTGILSKSTSRLPSSTIFSSLKRMSQQGTLVKTEKGYEIDDPFLRQWIVRRRGT